MINAEQFVDIYTELVEEFEHVSHPDADPAIRRLYYIYPRDLVTPVACFVNRDHARGFVASLLFAEVTKMKAAVSV